MPKSSEHDKTVTITVDTDPYQVDKGETMASDIVRLTGKDPAVSYLVEIQGRHQESYKDRPEAMVKVHEHSTFVTASSPPTTVSWR